MSFLGGKGNDGDGSARGGDLPHSSPNIQNALEVAMAGAAEVGRVSRRLIQSIWDPEPVNNRTVNEPAWCLGSSYTLNSKAHESPRPASTTPAKAIETSSGATTSTDANTSDPDSSQDSAVSSFQSTFTNEEPGYDGGWPPAFLDDFESRIWMTYRTGFQTIPKLNDPKASTAMSLKMRLKSSFSDHQGFSSDTGWGCMIRSGQSLLANAIAISRLGRCTDTRYS
jgi:cysteine protease ATG4